MLGKVIHRLWFDSRWDLWFFLIRLKTPLKTPLHRDGKYVMTERAIESGTSMTCGYCGWRDEHLGFNRMFECHVCDLSIDRDVNGARNNGLQALADGGFGRPPEYWNTHV